LNDVLLEQLANDGNGNYTYVDDLDEARKLFVDNLTSTLQVIALDAKIQVDFNPGVVAYYRLVGDSPWAAGTSSQQLVNHAYRLSSLLWDDADVVEFASLVSRAS